MLEQRGLVKLMEECGELTQIAAKKVTRMDSDEHWDGGGSLAMRLENEIGDVIAAATVVADNFDLDRDRIAARVAKKVALFRQWMNET